MNSTVMRKEAVYVQTFNYHTHTKRCGHASGTDEDYVKAAIQAGYSILGFSDHAPYKNVPLDWARMSYDKLFDYIQSVNRLKEEYKDRLEIHLGLETEFYPEYLEEKRKLRDKVEYLILGQHFTDPSAKRSFFRPSTDEEILQYAENICRGLDTGLFTYLAHPDVYVFQQEEFNETCRKAAHIICKKAEETGTPLEINVHGILRGKHLFENGEQYYYPHKDFWRIAAGYNVKCLFGIDAHNPSQLTDLESLRKAEEELSDLGLQYVKDPLSFR